METKAEKLARINRMIKTNNESRYLSMKGLPVSYLIEKIDSLHMYLDTILRSYLDAIKFMTNEQVIEFGKWMNEQIIEFGKGLDEKYKNNG